MPCGIIKSSSSVRPPDLSVEAYMLIRELSERQKVVRKLNQTKKALESADKSERKKLEAELLKYRSYLNYILVCRMRLFFASHSLIFESSTIPKRRNTSPYTLLRFAKPLRLPLHSPPLFLPLNTTRLQKSEKKFSRG